MTDGGETYDGLNGRSSLDNQPKTECSGSPLFMCPQIRSTTAGLKAVLAAIVVECQAVKWFGDQHSPLKYSQ